MTLKQLVPENGSSLVPTWILMDPETAIVKFWTNTDCLVYLKLYSTLFTIG